MGSGLSDAWARFCQVKEIVMKKTVKNGHRIRYAWLSHWKLFFFFTARSGIRSVEGSSGLGNVYKEQTVGGGVARLRRA